jgi:hypothetical protein
MTIFPGNKPGWIWIIQIPKSISKPYQQLIKSPGVFWNFFSELCLIINLLLVDPAIWVISQKMSSLQINICFFKKKCNVSKFTLYDIIIPIYANKLKSVLRKMHFQNNWKKTWPLINWKLSGAYIYQRFDNGINTKNYIRNPSGFIEKDHRKNSFDNIRCKTRIYTISSTSSVRFDSTNPIRETFHVSP